MNIEQLLEYMVSWDDLDHLNPACITWIRKIGLNNPGCMELDNTIGKNNPYSPQPWEEAF